VRDADLAAVDGEDLRFLFRHATAKLHHRRGRHETRRPRHAPRALRAHGPRRGDPQSFRARAYESAAQAIAAQGTDLGELTAKELLLIQGIGKSTAAKVRELLENGKVTRLEELRAKHPASVVALLRIQGIGPKAVHKLRARAGVQSIDDLRKALASHKVRGAEGLRRQVGGEAGARAGAPGRARLLDRTPISVALPLAERIVARLLEVPGVTHASYCGSLRRFSRPSGTSTWSSRRRTRAGDGGARLDDRRRARARPRSGQDQRRHAPRDADRPARRGGPPARRGAPLLHGLEGAQHQAPPARPRARLDAERVRALRARRRARSSPARPRRRSTRRSACPGFRPSCARTPARSRPRRKARCRSRWARSSATSTCTRPSRATGARRWRRSSRRRRARGYRALAITDHAEGTLSGVGREAFLEQRAQIRALNRELGDVDDAPHGVELNIGPAGELDYDAEFRAGFDFCIASVHDHFELDRGGADTARRGGHAGPVGAHDRAPLGAHDRRPPADRARPGRHPGAAEETGTALEVNGGLPRLDMSVDALRRARLARAR
jgi:DNA polymerase (family 10)